MRRWSPEGGQPLSVGFDYVESAADRLVVRLWSGNASRPVWTYWFPLLCFLSPGTVQFVPVVGPNAARGRFVYPIELRYEADEWCEGAAPDDLIAVLPPSAERAIAARRALVVVSIAHEGRPLFDAASQSGGLLLDRLAAFARWYGLAAGQLWFLSGNLEADSDVRAWCRHRGIARAPVTLRVCEPFSAFTGGCARESLLRGRVPAVRVRYDRLGPHAIGWQGVELSWAARPFPGLVPDRAAGPATFRFACLNRSFRAHRWQVLERLWRDDLLVDGLVSFSKPTVADLREEGIDPGDKAVRALLARLPLKVDRAAHRDDRAYFADNIDFVSLHPGVVLRDCAMELVTETRQGGCQFVSEKTFKALLGRGPAVVIGTQGTLAYLRSIGARSWPEVVDEGYDEIGDPEARFVTAMDAAADLIRRPGWESTDTVSVRSHNVRWLTESRKPWDELTTELGEALRCL